MKSFGNWVAVSDGARAQGVSVRTFRRRLLMLHEQVGGVLKSFNRPGTKVRKWFYNPDVTRIAVELGVRLDAVELKVESLMTRMDESEAKLVVLRTSINSVNRKVKAARQVVSG